MVASLRVLAILLLAFCIATATVPKEPPAGQDPTGKWRVELVADYGGKLESKGHDFSNATLEISIKNKTCELTLEKAKKPSCIK